MKKLAIIGASYLQEPLIQKAKEMGLETHVFAWQCGDVGEDSADVFYPISIVEKEAILEKCKEIQIDGICSIASDLAAITVNYVANAMGLIGNTMECTQISTNKHLMRIAFEKNGDPSPKSIMVESAEDLQDIELQYPIIVKPLDRSGSRGITKLNDAHGLVDAIETAKEQGFDKHALIEEFVTGKEYSVECISYRGEHHFLALTKKYTTGSPHFIETGHVEPGNVTEEMLEKIKNIVFHALDSLHITNSASHTELKITEDGNIRIIEIGGRMGGDYIGSNLVQLSTGVDFVKAVIEVALGEKPDLCPKNNGNAAGVRFVFSEKDKEIFMKMQKEHPEYIIYHEIKDVIEGEVTDSASRFGVFLFAADSEDVLKPYLPDMMRDV